jgi:hypothetical protein
MVISESLLGGALAAAAGLIADSFRNWLRERAARKRLASAIRDDLSESLGLYDRLVQYWQANQMVWFTTTEAFGASRASYERNRDWTILFSD